MYEATIQVHNMKTISLEPKRTIKVAADLISELVEKVDVVICENAFELSLGNSLTVSYHKNK